MKNQFLIKQYHIEGYVVYEHQNYKPGRYSFSFLMEGEALIGVEGKNFLMNPGQLLLVPMGQEIVIKHVLPRPAQPGCYAAKFLVRRRRLHGSPVQTHGGRL